MAISLTGSGLHLANPAIIENAGTYYFTDETFPIGSVLAGLYTSDYARLIFSTTMTLVCWHSSYFEIITKSAGSDHQFKKELFCLIRVA